MSEAENKIGETITKAWPEIPDEKKSYLLGFVEGVAAMVRPRDEPRQEDQRE